jgi:hypothetical protein
VEQRGNGKEKGRGVPSHTHACAVRVLAAFIDWLADWAGLGWLATRSLYLAGWLYGRMDGWMTTSVLVG